MWWRGLVGLLVLAIFSAVTTGIMWVVYKAFPADSTNGYRDFAAAAAVAATLLVGTLSAVSSIYVQWLKASADRKAGLDLQSKIAELQSKLEEQRTSLDRLANIRVKVISDIQLAATKFHTSIQNQLTAGKYDVDRTDTLRFDLMAAGGLAANLSDVERETVSEYLQAVNFVADSAQFVVESALQVSEKSQQLQGLWHDSSQGLRGHYQAIRDLKPLELPS